MGFSEFFGEPILPYSQKEKCMKHNKIARLCFSVILTAAMLLPSCGGETPAPAENSSDAVSQTGSETSSDTTPEEKPFRSLSDKEAEALFGVGFSQTKDRKSVV